MVDPELLTPAALDASLADLGRRIDDAKADADRRASNPPASTAVARPFPWLWVAALVLVVAVIAGGLALAGSSGSAGTAGGVAGNGAELAGVGGASGADGASAAAVAQATGAASAAVDDLAAEITASLAQATADGTADGTATADSVAVAVPGGTASSPSGAGGAAVANAPNQTVRELTVLTGDSFWSIAEREVSAQLGRPATDAEVTGWWADLVAANTDRLVEPGNPNLVLPGQVLVAPTGVG